MALDIGKIKEYGSIEFLAKQLVEGFITGHHKSPFHGFSVEFAEHRLYNAGESTRHIDWRVFGKTDKLFVKKYDEETNLRCHLLIDVSSSMYFPEKGQNKIQFATLAAGCLAYLLQKQRDAVGLISFAHTIEIETPIKTTSAHIYSIFMQLDEIQALPNQGKTSNIAQVLHLIAEKAHSRSLIVVFSDMLETKIKREALFSSLQHLRHKKHEILLFHVFDKKLEFDFEFDNRPYQFKDMETGEIVKLQPQDIKEAYQKEIKNYFDEIKLKCLQYRINFIEVDINEGFDQIMQGFLLSRK